MIVLDASVVTDLLLAGPEGGLAERVLGAGDPLHAPHLLDLEVAQALRRLERAGVLAPHRAVQALELLAAFPLFRHEHRSRIWRVWQLRHRLTAYDAAYLALAEALGCRLVTRDAGLAAAARGTITVELI